MIDEKFVMEILKSREERRDKQLDLIGKYKASLISFTLNSPGIVKDNEMYRSIHKVGMKAIRALLKEEGIKILHEEARNKSTGSEGFIVVEGDPRRIKEKLIELEMNHPLGRIFDIDVFDKEHRQISRSELKVDPRRCLICNQPARICIRERNHTMEELYAKIESLWKEFIDEEI